MTTPKKPSTLRLRDVHYVAIAKDLAAEHARAVLLSVALGRQIAHYPTGGVRTKGATPLRVLRRRLEIVTRLLIDLERALPLMESIPEHLAALTRTMTTTRLDAPHRTRKKAAHDVDRLADARPVRDRIRRGPRRALPGRPRR